MHSMLVLLAAGLYCPAACQQYQKTHDHFSLPGGVPLLSDHRPGFSPRSLAPSALAPPTTNEDHYTPEFREFRSLVPTNFITIDSRFTYPSRFYYESTLYMTERPIHTFYSFPLPPGYYQPLSSNYPPQVFKPGGYSYNSPASNLHTPTYPEFFNSEKGNPQSYPRHGSYAPSFRDPQPPQVYETRPLLTNYRPKPPLIPSTSPNIVRDDETSTRGTILQTNDIDVQNRPFYPNPPLYNTQSTTELPRFATTVSRPVGNSGGDTFPPGFTTVDFVPSLFDIRPTSPPRVAPPIFVASDSPNIVRGETSPSTTAFPSTTNPGYDVSEPTISTYFPTSEVSGLPLSTFIPTSSPEQSTYFPDETLKGLFAPRTLTTSYFHPVPPGGSPNLRSRQPQVGFEAPGHDHPK